MHCKEFGRIRSTSSNCGQSSLLRTLKKQENMKNRKTHMRELIFMTGKELLFLLIFTWKNKSMQFLNQKKSMLLITLVLLKSPRDSFRCRNISMFWKCAYHSWTSWCRNQYLIQILKHWSKLESNRLLFFCTWQRMAPWCRLIIDHIRVLGITQKMSNRTWYLLEDSCK